MILVTVGASQFPFDRLLHAVDRVAEREVAVVQHGPSDVRPRGARCVPFLPVQTLGELVREARVVVTHGGVGSILLALANGKRPYVVPRRRAFGETVDDHQVESARRFEQAGLVTMVDDLGLLADLIARPAPSVASSAGGGRLAGELREYIRSVAGEPVGSR